MAVITANSINTIISQYNGDLGTSIPYVAAGDKIESAVYSNIITTVQNACASQDKYCVLPSLSDVAVGRKVKNFAWPLPVTIAGTTVAYTVPGTYTFTATTHSVMFNWVVAGGGSGGTGTEYGYGGGGGGGGSGGYYRYFLVNCVPGDIFTLVVGAGGAQPVATSLPSGNGNQGGDTMVYLNGNLILKTTGGGGGSLMVPNTVNQVAKGGVGGLPNGAAGQDGAYGLSDYASVYGAGGAPSPVSGSMGGAGGNRKGGDPYNGPSAGKAGVGYGSGGGGGGEKDRCGIHYWAGGAGAPGFIEFTYPSQGATGGTPAQSISSYSTQAAINAATGGHEASTGGGFVSGSGSDPNGVANSN